MEYAIAVKTDVGRERSTNQDSLYVRTASWNGQNYAFAVICDGMGGLSDGDMASRTVAEAMSSWFENGFADWLNDGGRESTLCGIWTEVLNRCNARLIQYGREKGIELGTTVTALLLGPERYVIVHIGDTRAYEIGGVIRQLTRDHTLATRMVESGVISRAEARKVPENHVLTRCIGVGESIDPAFYFGATAPDAVYLLCSDGFRNQFEEKELREAFDPAVCLDAAALVKACEDWIKVSLERREDDNISAVVIRTIPTMEPVKPRRDLDMTIVPEDTKPKRPLDDTVNLE